MKEETVGKEHVNLNALIDETLEIIGAEAERDGITISVALDPQTVFVLGDRIQLQQVLMNFIRNATAAMENNKRQAKFLEVALRLEKDEAVVSVRDSGPGLDPTVKENLFKPFVSTKKEGFGIGLALCKSLIEKHNGKIWADSVPGGGAIFAFSLPIMKK
jgi:two-component system sensor kinase FixL